MKLLSPENVCRVPVEPAEDPVLKSYAKCLASDILCVWRRAPSGVHRHPPQHHGYPFANDHGFMGGYGMPPHHHLPPHMGGPHPPTPLLQHRKELWIFWYGDEPDLGEFVCQELLDSGEKGERW